MHDVSQLETVATEFEKAFAAKDLSTIQSLVKLCQKVETDKQSIIKSPLNKTLFKIEKAWRLSQSPEE